MRIRPRTAAASLLAAPLAAALISGCTSSAGTPIATAPQPAGQSAHRSTSTSTGHLTDMQRHVASVRAYARCLRAAGFDMPDPDAQGHMPGSSGADLKRRAIADPKVMKVLERCSKLIVPAPPEPLSPAELASARKNAQCMRDHGVPDYPDPAPVMDSPQDRANQQLLNRLAATPAYQRAIVACDGGGVARG